MNMTCAITRTPIRPGQAARVIFLRKSVSEKAHPSGAVNATDEWAPISFPIPMKYEDFGQFYLTDESDWRCGNLLRGIEEFWEEEHEDDLTLESLFAAVWKGDVSLPDNHPMNRNHASKDGAAVGVMAMHEDAYNLMVRSFYDAGKVTTARQMAEDIRSYFLQRKDFKWFEDVAEPVSPAADFWFATRSSGGSVRVHGQIGPSPADIMHTVLIDLTNGGDIDSTKNKEMIDTAAEMLILQENMCAMAMPYAPQMMASDDFCVDLMNEINEIGLRIYNGEEPENEDSMGAPNP